MENLYDLSNLDKPLYAVDKPSTRWLCWTYSDYFRGVQESLEHNDKQRAQFQIAYLKKIAAELEKRDPVAFEAWKVAQTDHGNPERFFSLNPNYSKPNHIEGV